MWLLHQQDHAKHDEPVTICDEQTIDFKTIKINRFAKDASYQIMSKGPSNQYHDGLPVEKTVLWTPKRERKREMPLCNKLCQAKNISRSISCHTTNVTSWKSWKGRGNTTTRQCAHSQFHNGKHNSLQSRTSQILHRKRNLHNLSTHKHYVLTNESIAGWIKDRRNKNHQRKSTLSVPPQNIPAPPSSSPPLFYHTHGIHFVLITIISPHHQ